MSAHGANVTALSGAAARLLSLMPSDADQLCAFASMLRIVREAIRDEEALQRLDWLLLDLQFLATQAQRAEAESERLHHMQMRRRA